MLLRSIVIGLLASLPLASDAVAAAKTDREKNDLIGPVRSVVTITPDSSFSDAYDRAGRLAEAIVYQRDEHSSMRYVFTYNERGDLKEEIGYEADGTVIYRKLFAYAHDPGGRETAVAAASQDGEFHHVEFSLYERHGTVSETIYADRTITSRTLFDVLGRLLYSGQFRAGQLLGETGRTYDSRGRLIAATSYSPGGAVTGRVVHEYDDAGKRIKTTTETIQHGGTNRWITTYEYDGAGNWIKELTTQEPSTPSATKSAPNQILQERLIDYYDTH